MSELIEATGKQAAAQALFCIEYLGYHSCSYKRIPPSVSGGYLPTQLYAASLVKRAIAQRKMIVLMRARSEWLGLVPELKSYEGIYVLKNPQRVYLSRGNMDKFDQLISVVSEA